MAPEQLQSFRWIVVNSSGGKDSQTALAVTVAACDAAGVPRDRIVVSHQCLGTMEWEGTLELAKAQAEHYGLRFEVSKYRDKAQAEPSLLEYVEKRGKWPSSKARFCTSEFKRGPGGRVLVRLARESAGNILNVYGFRAQESTARASKKPMAVNTRFTTEARKVIDWLPIHTWTESEVWAHIRQSGVRHHYAYDLGMPRLSCVFCIFAPREALVIAGKANPGLLERYVATEKKIGHTFTQKLSLREVQEMIQTA